MSFLYPIGIPPAWIEPTIAEPGRPADWSSPVAGYYYVNQQTGTDSGRAYGTPTAPRATAPRPIPPGSRVELHGTYNKSSGGTTFIEGAGTSGAFVAGVSGPVWVVTEDGSRAVIDRATVIYGSYLYLENIDFTVLCQIGSSTAGRPADYMLVRGCTNVGDGVTSRSAFSIGGSSTNPISNIILYNNIIHDLGDFNSLLDLDCLWATSGAYSTNVWVLDNEAYRVVGGARAGSASVGADPALQRFHFWGRNNVHDCKQNAMSVKYGKDIVFSQNIVDEIFDNGAGLSPGKCFGAQYKPDGVWFIFNRCSNSRYGIHGASSDSGGPYKLYAIGNIITQCRAPGIYPGGSTDESAIMCRSSYDLYVLNNVLDDNDVHLDSSGGSGVHIYSENNVFGPRTSGSLGNTIYIENSPDNCVIKNSIFYDPDTVKIRWGAGTVYTSLAAFQAGESNGVACLQQDPELNGSYQPLLGSPCINSGTPTTMDTLLDLYESIFGLSISVDFAGNDRPIAQWDMGAYEFGADDVVASPEFAPLGDTYQSAQDVVITSDTSGATIHYTTNGNTPTSGSAVYSTPINVSVSLTIKAIALKAGLTDSAVSQAVYVIDSQSAPGAPANFRLLPNDPL